MLLANYTLFYSDLKTRGIEYAAEHSLALGFNAVEFFLGYPDSLPLFDDLKEAERAAQVLKGYGLPTACVSIGASLFGADSKAVEAALCRYAEVAAILGSPYLHHTVYLPLSLPLGAPSYDEVFGATVDAVERIATRAESVGVTCLYEPQGMYFNGIDGLAPLLGEIRRRGRRVGICGDVGNPLYVDADPAELFDRFAGDILHVHLKDYFVRRQQPDEAGYTPSRGGRYLKPCELGEGDIDLSSCFRALRSAEYHGAYAFELFGTDEVMRRAIETFKSLYVSVFGA